MSPGGPRQFELTAVWLVELACLQLGTRRRSSWQQLPNHFSSEAWTLGLDSTRIDPRRCCDESRERFILPGPELTRRQ